MEPSENSSMISRARVRSRARKAGRVRSARLWLVRKLDDDRDWLFPSASWQNDPDLFGG